MAGTKERLAVLRKYLKTLSADKTTFIVAGGTEFHTDRDPLSYLLEYGPYTPDGRRIVLYPHTVEGVDPLSLSIYQTVDAAIEAGRLDWPDDLEGDEPNGRN